MEKMRTTGRPENDSAQLAVDEKGDLDQKDPNSNLSSTTKLDARHAARFMCLFDGHDSVHGVYNNISDHREDGKILGTDRRTVRGAVTIELYQNHLEGTNGLGIVPIKADSTVRFGAIDIDVYAELSHAALANVLASNKLPLIVCRSKSGGAHIYCFTSEPVAARLMVRRLEEVAAILGHGNAEIFPKQMVIANDRGDAGSWINLPMFNGLLGARYAVRPDGDAMEMEEFLETAEQLRQPPDWFEQSLHKIPEEMPQGPPCLQHLIQTGFPQGTRNQGLYNIGVYLQKLDPDNWESLLKDANRKYMQPPLDSTEVKTVTSSVKKKKYFYSCSQQPIAAHCNKAVCRTRKYGIGGEGALEYGGLTKITTDPPTWFWTVNGKRLELCTEELQDAYKFQKKCMAVLTEMPRIPKREEWEEEVRKAMRPENVNILDPPEDTTALGRFKEVVCEFCTSRAQACSRDEMLLSKPWDDGKFTWFQISNLIEHLNRKKFAEFKITGNELYKRLRDIGAVSVGNTRIKGRNVSLWKIQSFPKQTEGHDLPAGLVEERVPF